MIFLGRYTRYVVIVVRNFSRITVVGIIHFAWFICDTKQRLQNVMFAMFHVTEASILCDKLLRLTHFSHSYRFWRTDFSLPVLRQTVVIDTFFAFRSFLLEEQNFQLPLSACLLLTWRARVKRNPPVTLKIRVAGLYWARN